MSQGVAVVVGAGPGLGSALGRRFASAGMKVALARRRTDALEALARELGGEAYACDAADEASVRTLFERVAADLGTPELVVYNAGTYRPGKILDIEARDFVDCWRIGCLGGFHVGQAAARDMVEAGRGTIIFTGATASLRGGPGFANLAVPKFGLRALAQSMARELGPQGVHVAHVIIDGQIASEQRPGYSETERGADAVLKPDAIADTYYQLHAQPRSTWTHELDLRPWVEKF
ncbi:MAG: SDR family NAD(P)-dependent oxidoreductase [Gammaproteobacteria bacterium]|nr:SDR family NAD(P)-dependent oxidoreductase [Gammaproteobacteria bacterium]NIR83806.1 SDR family NAD(P)-dependent oxidoreductase [Gammaproteobacteria bacterium]NIR88223.1 SDR family NAD(P)-dependent oxidoreductase [Gammaproteobacteria bacterium]NIU05132.1 SDR family NAD(P)-dependent oxidoreductase [Gammaproteobacteria bacterium]NIV51969.1 SDR family NAD(P)-dependent oxidoreductase [Gammaproteobacteria bacterium]